MRRLTVVLVAAFIGTLGAGTGARTAQRDALLKLLTPPMSGVVKLVALETWNPRFDEFVQKFPAAAPLGDKWNTSAPAWQKARGAMGSRLTRILDLYAASGEQTRELQAGLDKNFPGDQAAALHRVLTGPNGPAIIRFEAEAAFLTGVPSRPDAPSPGDPAWMTELRDRIKRARAVLDPLLPPRDVKLEEGAAKFSKEPLGGKHTDLWRTVVGKAGSAIDGAINLMMFDDREAIVRDMMQAIATVK